MNDQTPDHNSDPAFAGTFVLSDPIPVTEAEALSGRTLPRNYDWKRVVLNLKHNHPGEWVQVGGLLPRGTVTSLRRYRLDISAKGWSNADKLIDRLYARWNPLNSTIDHAPRVKAIEDEFFNETLPKTREAHGQPGVDALVLATSWAPKHLLSPEAKAKLETSNSQ